jgi:hypothetical protein
MAELELTRTPDDRRVYAIDGVGTMRLEGLLSRRASAEAGTSRWQFARTGVFASGMEATDAAGAVQGRFTGRTLRRGGTLRWGERELELRSSSMFRERYALSDGERELALLDGKGWGKRPVKITLDDPAAVEPGLLMFAAFVVRGLAEDAGAAAGGAAAATSAATAG